MPGQQSFFSIFYPFFFNNSSLTKVFPHFGHFNVVHFTPCRCGTFSPHFAHTQKPPVPEAPPSLRPLPPPRPKPRPPPGFPFLSAAYPIPLPVPGPKPSGPVPSFLGIIASFLFIIIYITSAVRKSAGLMALYSSNGFAFGKHQKKAASTER